MGKLLKSLSFKKVLNDDSGEMLSDEQISELQNCLTKIVGEIVEVCDKYELKPMLIGGSLLGFVRHNGYIPWDDDLDIAMYREDYEKLIQVYEEELSDKFEIRAPKKNYPTANRFLQLYRKDTLLEGPNLSKNVPHTIYIDVFPIDYAPANCIVRRLKGIRCNMLMTIAGFTDTYKSMTPELKRQMCRSQAGKCLYIMRMVIGWLFSWRSPKKWMQTVDKSIQWKRKSPYVTIATGRGHYFGEIIPSDTMFPLKEVVFEGVNLHTPNNPDGYLKNLYGDYMQIPPVEKREKHFAFKIKTL